MIREHNRAGEGRGGATFEYRPVTELLLYLYQQQGLYESSGVSH